MNLSLFKSPSNALICFCFFILVSAPAQGSDLCRLFIEQLGVEVGQSLTVYGSKSRRPKVVYAVGEQLVFRAHNRTVEIVTREQTHMLTLPIVVRSLSVLPFGEAEEGMRVRPHLFTVEHTGGVRIYRFDGEKHRVLDSSIIGGNVRLGVESIVASRAESVLTPIIFWSTENNLNVRMVGLEFSFRRSKIEYLDNTMIDGPIHSIAIAPSTRAPEVVEGPNSFIVGVVDSHSISAFDLEEKSISILSSHQLSPARYKRILVAGKVFVDGESEPQTAFHVFTGDHLQTFALVRAVLRPVASRQLRGRVESAAAGTVPGDLHYLMRDTAGQLHRVRLQVSGSLVLEEQVFPVFDLLPPGNN
jgi:hypothetical protein